MSITRQSRTHAVSTGVWVIVSGGVMALVGTYWDEVWHTDRGRDAFASPPHLVLYAGVALMLVVAAVWARRWWRAEAGVRGLVTVPARWLPLLGAVVTLAGAPVDELWHRAFGRDAVMWSPPHLLGVAGLLALGGGVMLLVRGRAGRLLAAATAALVLGPAVVLVMEYESDVPQFALGWYLPVLGAGLALAFGLIRQANPRPWAAADGAVAYTVGRGATVALLAALGHSLVIVPPVVAPALVDDVLARGRVPMALRALTLALTVHVVYPLYHAMVPGGLRMTVGQVLVGVPLTVAASWTAFAALTWRSNLAPSHASWPRRAPLAVLAVLAPAVLLAAPAPVWAHDPGQGERVADIRLAATVQAHRVEVTGAVHGGCGGLRPMRVTARRAGDERHGPLRATDPCTYAGAVDLNADGRWFVYLELRDEDRQLEAWLPVSAPGSGQERKDAVLYLATPTRSSSGQVAAGVALYGLTLAVVAALVWAYRKQAAAGEYPRSRDVPPQSVG